MSKPRIDVKVNIPDQVLRELLTSSEIRMLKNRWQIINLLEDGLSIREIAGQVKVGTDTVVRVIKMVDKNSILSNREKGLKNIKSATPWIFGKNG
ncbi:MAG: Trp family transcriptional regulator [Candidatus Daviesbacteria bacterium]|nr:Trp family transcriptional regulator [Candidatus Daviesbacteria bacterium]